MSAAPTKLGRYLVRAKLGEGGMATVYVGKVEGAPSSEHAVALKVVKDEFALNPDFVTMFLDEAKIVSRLVHPQIVRLYELGVDSPSGDRRQHRLFLAMELLFGQSLWDVWDACRARGVRLRYEMVAWIGARVAEALHHAHELADENGHPLDVVHRDVNATNIFITYDGKVKVIDFGLAKARNRVFQTAAGIIKGKTAYMSPEQAVGQALDRRTDVFALGTTLWEITVDQRLFKQKDDVETLKRVYAAEVPDPRALVDGFPDDLWGILRMSLARERTDRFASAGAMARALSHFADAEGPIGEADVSAVMNALFADEKARQAEWLHDASQVDRPAPKGTMRPPSELRGAHIDAVGGTMASMQPLPPPPRNPREVPGPAVVLAGSVAAQVDAAAARALPSMGLRVGPDGLFAPPPSRPLSSRNAEREPRRPAQGSDRPHDFGATLPSATEPPEARLGDIPKPTREAFGSRIPPAPSKPPPAMALAAAEALPRGPSTAPPAAPRESRASSHPPGWTNAPDPPAPPRQAFGLRLPPEGAPPREAAPVAADARPAAAASSTHAPSPRARRAALVIGLVMLATAGALALFALGAAAARLLGR